MYMDHLYKALQKDDVEFFKITLEDTDPSIVVSTVIQCDCANILRYILSIDVAVDPFLLRESVMNQNLECWTILCSHLMEKSASINILSCIAIETSLCSVIDRNLPEFYNWFIDRYINIKYFKRVLLSKCAENEKYDIITRIHQKEPLTESELGIVVRESEFDIDTVKWFIGNDFEFTSDFYKRLFNHSIESGKTTLIQYLLNNKVPSIPDIYKYSQFLELARSTLSGKNLALFYWFFYKNGYRNSDDSLLQEIVKEQERKFLTFLKSSSNLINDRDVYILIQSYI